MYKFIFSYTQNLCTAARNHGRLVITSLLNFYMYLGGAKILLGRKPGSACSAPTN